MKIPTAAQLSKKTPPSYFPRRLLRQIDNAIQLRQKKIAQYTADIDQLQQADPQTAQTKQRIRWRQHWVRSWQLEVERLRHWARWLKSGVTH